MARKFFRRIYMNKKQKVALVLFGLLLPLLFGEILLRFIGYSAGLYQLDSKTGLSILIPNNTFNWIKPCFNNKVTTNSEGFNSLNYPVTKADGVFRIVMLGDSFVEGLQVPLEKSFHSLLEEKLNARPDKKYRYEVIPLGHSGNGTYLNLLYLQNYGLKYKPDLVINGFLVGNDFRDDSLRLTQEYSDQTGDKVVFQKPFPVFDDKGQLAPFKKAETPVKRNWSRQVLGHSALAVYLYGKYNEIRSNFYTRSHQAVPMLANNATSAAKNNLPVDYQVFIRDYPTYWNDVWANEDRLLTNFKDIAKSSSAKFLLVSLTEPFRVHESLALKGGYQDKTKFDFDKAETLLSDMSSRETFPYLPLVPVFRVRAKVEPDKMTAFSCDGHWNETGHAWAADALYDYLSGHPDLISR